MSVISLSIYVKNIVKAIVAKSVLKKQFYRYENSVIFGTQMKRLHDRGATRIVVTSMRTSLLYVYLRWCTSRHRICKIARSAQ